MAFWFAQQMVHWWFGLVVWIPGIQENERIITKGQNDSNPHRPQFTNLLGGAFKYFLFSLLFGEDFHFDL